MAIYKELSDFVHLGGASVDGVVGDWCPGGPLLVISHLTPPISENFLFFFEFFFVDFFCILYS